MILVTAKRSYGAEDIVGAIICWAVIFLMIGYTWAWQAERSRIESCRTDSHYCQETTK
jgi:hypothetical protein